LTVDPNGATQTDQNRKEKAQKAGIIGLPTRRDISLDKADCGQYKDKIPLNAVRYGNGGAETGP
jgi:hypothetical protein